MGGGEDGADPQGDLGHLRRDGGHRVQRPRGSQGDLDDRHPAGQQGPGQRDGVSPDRRSPPPGSPGRRRAGWWTDSCAGPLSGWSLDRLRGCCSTRGVGSSVLDAGAVARWARVCASVGTRPVPPRPPTTSDDAAAASRAAGDEIVAEHQPGGQGADVRVAGAGLVDHRRGGTDGTQADTSASTTWTPEAPQVTATISVPERPKPLRRRDGRVHPQQGRGLARVGGRDQPAVRGQLGQQLRGLSRGWSAAAGSWGRTRTAPRPEPRGGPPLGPTARSRRRSRSRRPHPAATQHGSPEGAPGSASNRRCPTGRS